MKKIALLLISFNLLTGCVAAFIVGAAVGGIVVFEGRNASVKKQDFELTKSISRKINADKALKSRARIIVSAYDGVVLLAGQAPDPALKAEAAELAESVPGIKRLYNEITISGPISSLAQSSDTWITTKVKSKLLSAKGLDSSQIKVVTENGIVYLFGKVTKGQAAIASETASGVQGVQKVVTLFARPA